MYQLQSQFEYDLHRTLAALKSGIKNVPEVSSERIIQLLEYKNATASYTHRPSVQGE